MPSNAHTRAVVVPGGRVERPPVVSPAEAALAQGKEQEQRGRLDAAAREFATAAARATTEPSDLAAKAEALRRQASISRRRQDFDAALELCQQSCTVAASIPDDELVAEALNGLGAVQF